jgi:hypothetical protein
MKVEANTVRFVVKAPENSSQQMIRAALERAFGDIRNICEAAGLEVIRETTIGDKEKE